LPCECRDDQDKPSHHSGIDPDRSHTDFQPSYMQATLAEVQRLQNESCRPIWATELRNFTDSMPARIARLERDPRGYPIPWFVDRPADGGIDFRVMDPQWFLQTAKERRCCVCGDRLGEARRFCGWPSLGCATPFRRSSCAPRMCGVLGKGLSVPSHSICSET
jgi:hypothetical protein